MTQQEYSDLVAGHLSPEEIQRLTNRYGADTIAAILRGEKQLHDVMSDVASNREAIDDLEILWDPKDLDRQLPFLARYAVWLLTLGVIVLVVSLVAILPRLGSVSAGGAFSFTDPLPLTIAVILLVGLGAMIAMERNDAG